MREHTQSVNLSKESKREIIAALHDIRKTIAEENRKTQTFMDNVADSMTSGGSFTSSIRDAIRIETNRETAKLRKALDPLTIIKKITGGSKFATTLAGKVLGRSNEDIRKHVGFRDRDPHSPEPTRSVPPPPVTPMEKDGAIPLLEQIAKSLSLITMRVSDIADKIKATKKVELDANGRLRDKVSGKMVSAKEAQSLAEQNKLLKEMRDAFIGLRTDEKQREDVRRDQTRLLGAKQLRTPTVQVDTKGKEIVKPQTIDQSPLLTLLGSFTKLSGIIAGVSAALGALLHPVEAFRSTMGAVTKGVEAVKESFSFFQSGEKITSAVKSADKLAETGVASKAVVSGTRIAQKVLPKVTEKVVPKVPEVATQVVTKVPEKAVEVATKTGEVASQALPKVAEPATKAAVQTGKAISRTSKAVTTTKATTKIGKDKLSAILSKKLPSAFGGTTLGKLIPGIGAALGLGFAVSRLVKGDLVGAALEGISGFGGAATAIPAIVAQLVRDVYQDAYGIFPEKDPLSGERLPELADIVKSETASWLKGKSKDTKEVDGPKKKLAQASRESGTPVVGTKLADSTSKHKELVAMGGSPTVSTPAPSISVNNVKSVKSSTILAPGMPSSRSQDSSYLRSLDNALP